MCDVHSPEVLNQPDKSKPVSREFSDLGLEGKHAGAYHCAEHDHVVKGELKALLWVGVGVAVLGVIVMLANVAAGLTLLLAGAGLATGCYLANQRRKDAALADPPPLPVIPNLESISVLETLHGRVGLDDSGHYTSLPDPVQGRIDVVMALAKPDRDRLALYREKYQPAEDDRIEFSAGFCMIQGTAGVVFSSPAEPAVTPLPGGTGNSFRSDVATHPLFATSDAGSSRRWTAHSPYGLHRTRAPESIPIWLVPSLVPDSDRRTLELDLHWAGRTEKEWPLVLDLFEEIELVVPRKWGSVDVKPNALISSPDPHATSRTIKWNQLRPTEGTQSLTLKFRFEEEIKPDEHDEEYEQDEKLTGRLRASFKGALSGMEGIGLYRPLGDPWLSPPAASVRTEVAVDFELSLKDIRYQDVRVVPDASKEDADRPEFDEFSVIPDYRTVIELTNELSDSHYVKRVIENPPRGGGKAGLVNRFWDIAGRRYHGVFPIDFHITLTGEEQHEGGVRANAGNTTARITVQGSYVDDDMKKKIEDEWDTLHDKVAENLEKRAFAAPVAAFERPYHADPSAQPPAQSPGQAPRQADDDTSRATTLRRRRDAATEALLDGRISEDTYRAVVAGIDAELGNL